MPFVTVDGSKVHYLVRPGGPKAVVLLHGGFGSSAELWSSTMQALPPQFTGYAIDNFLRSEAPPDFFAAYVQRACSAPLQAMISVQESLLSIDLRPRLAALNLPTLVVHAAHDSGHSPMVETPNDYNLALQRFLLELVGQPSTPSLLGPSP